MMTGKPIIPYEEIGAETLSQLVDAFYARVAAHPKLQPIFPDDLSETARKQKQFLKLSFIEIIEKVKKY